MPRHARPGHQHEEIGRLEPSVDHRGHEAALAHAEQAHRFRINAGPPLQEADGRGRVPGKVFGGGALKGALGRPHAALVVAEHGDALAGQVVGQDVEQLVVGDLRVAVLRPGAGDQHHRRVRPVAVGACEGAVQRETCRLVPDSHAVRDVRGRRFRVLRAGRRGRVCLVRRGERQRKRLPGLRPCAFDLDTVFDQHAFVRAGDAIDRERHAVAHHGDVGHRNAGCPLVGAVHRGGAPVAAPLDMEDNPQLGGPGVERARPRSDHALLRGDRREADDREPDTEQHQKPSPGQHGLIANGSRTT